ncbi:MAG: sigma-70 family RNA polymerase sigma factor [Alphaproteobacteria bacterium]|nr:sigma-70 family RNA polymerase sigma factor [Alphaproteobacteria bacterium]
MTAHRDPAELFVEHRADLVKYATRILGSRSSAEDVVQEAYLRFARHADGGEALGARGDRILEPVRYLYRIVRNLAYDWGRRPSMPLVGDLDDGLLARAASTVTSPEENLRWRQDLGRVERALDSLPDRTRQAFEMHRLGGLPLKEIAARLDISVTRTHQLVKTALTVCAEQLEDEAGEDGR